jgi:hypothetical protein
MPTTDAPMETGIMISDRTRAREFAADMGSKIPEGAGAGVMIGGAFGGVVAATTTTVAGVIITGGIALPFFAGPLTTILAGIGAGGLVGGIIGAFVGAGIPENRAREIMVGITPRDENRRAHAETGEIAPEVATDIPPRRTVS